MRLRDVVKRQMRQRSNAPCPPGSQSCQTQVDTGTLVHGRFGCAVTLFQWPREDRGRRDWFCSGSFPKGVVLELGLEDGRNLDSVDADRGEHCRGCAGLNGGPEARVFSVSTEWQWSGGSGSWKGRPGPNWQGHPEPGGKSRRSRGGSAEPGKPRPGFAV